ncbi:hypothetical protein M2137_000161 [Parabacteroides sp. PFB2-10]|uniref:DUF5053 domain-containing protein n=1 Tax=Parabacteroides sp. PFB2-10 TaxID=1742405 RepID=UPI002472FFBA|nr:DUF5053 domain-containing protein [Parabacteroides sp. PFB2-10]MDH6311411.1 hypothetical protein [Parabacteroides sp. PFB2-10]
MKTISTFLPTGEMQADFETYKNMSPAEREHFQNKRAERVESMTADEKQAFLSDTKKGLSAIKEELQGINISLELGDVVNAISLSYIAKTYFGKSKGWLYQRINGYKVNGKAAQFTEEERKLFAAALHDLSKRIEDTALKFA